MAKTVTVFGSSKPVESDEQYTIGYELGKKLGENRFNVCTGGFNGIMEAVSKGAAETGMEAIGVTVDTWGRLPNKYLTKELKCNSIFERVQKLIDAGDGFVVLQGGTGTLLELAAVWELCNKNIMDRKPVACHSSMWNEIVAIINLQMQKENRDTETVKAFGNIDEIVSYLKTKLSS
jgi:uncharacterized protein (TIGR00730 family)